MEEDLDYILLHQYHSSKSLGKKMVKARKLMGDDPLLIELQEMNRKRTAFFECMIQDKKILSKRKKLKKVKPVDFLAKSPLIDSYKFLMFASMYGYTLVVHSVKSYILMFGKGNKDG
jgi:hypothetical protein